MAELDPELLAFVRASFRSVWALEVLLYLRRHAPNPATEKNIVMDLRAGTALVATCLEQLEHAGLAVRDEDQRARFAPASPALTSLCDLLDAAYMERPARVINVIVSAPQKS